MMIDEVYSVAVMVTDRKKSADWYKQNLGFKVKEEGGDHWTVVAPNGSGSSFHLCEGQLEPGNTGILLLTKDFEGAVRELRKHGVEFTQEPKTTSWGTFAMFKDPDGNEFWLMPKS